LNGYVEYKFKKPTFVNKARFIFDSDLDRKTLPGDAAERTHTSRANVKNDSPVMQLPKTLIKEFVIELTNEEGNSFKFYTETNNIQRLVVIDINLRVTAIKIIPVSTWGNDEANIVSFDLY
jgi:hypothetical protein